MWPPRVFFLPKLVSSYIAASCKARSSASSSSGVRATTSSLQVASSCCRSAEWSNSSGVCCCWAAAAISSSLQQHSHLKFDTNTLYAESLQGLHVQDVTPNDYVPISICSLGQDVAVAMTTITTKYEQLLMKRRGHQLNWRKPVCQICHRLPPQITGSWLFLCSQTTLELKTMVIWTLLTLVICLCRCPNYY